jgi:ABC-type proline/glycine betaine transport system permease subunit
VIKIALIACLLISLASCVPATRDQDVANSAQTALNYAATLPPSPAVTQIMLQCVSIGHAMGHDLVPPVLPTTNPTAPAKAGKATP